MSRKLSPAEMALSRVKKRQFLGQDHPFWEGNPPPRDDPEEHRLLREQVLSEQRAREHRAREQQQPPSTPPASPEVASYSSEVEKQVAWMRAKKEATRILQAEEAETLELPPSRRLDVFQAEPDPEVPYLVEDLWPVGGHVVLAAQAKAGKTTLVDNLVRSLADGSRFLGKHATAQVPGVSLLDGELPESLLRSWLKGQGIAHPERVHVVSLRGQTHSANFLDDKTRARWAERIRATGSSVVILDPALPFLHAMGLDPNHEVGPFLDAFSALVHEAGATEGLVVHHSGHQNERPGGDSRWLGWPDAGWLLVRQDASPSSPRFFSAYGRDVDVPERRVLLEGHRLTVEDVSRRQAKVHDLVDLVVEAVTETPGLNARGLRDAVQKKGEGVRAQDVTKAADQAYHRGLLYVVDGPNRQKLHHPGAATDLTQGDTP